MIEASAILSGIVRHWDDLIIISILLVFNALVGFWQEYKAANALEALKKRPSKRQVAGNCCPQLVPGDVIRLPLQDIVPADVKLFDGDFLGVDQPALTGEYLPVSKRAGDIASSKFVLVQNAWMNRIHIR